jgi:PIN domain nuclease of toxin-antitoxin system
VTLLLDTHTFLWWLSNPACLSLDARVAIEDPGNQVLVSTVVLWEIAIKRTIGKLSANLNLETATQAAGFIVLPISVAHIVATEKLPLHHRDPFDRMLIAQTLVENATLLTRDQLIPQYGISTITA